MMASRLVITFEVFHLIICLELEPRRLREERVDTFIDLGATSVDHDEVMRREPLCHIHAHASADRQRERHYHASGQAKSRPAVDQEVQRALDSLARHGTV